MIAVPRVSVGIPTYNRVKTLKKAIQSVLEQTFRNFELIISDNASTDNTPQLVKSFNDPRIRYIQNKENIGVISNYNQCLKLFTGSYCAFLSSDDYWLLDFLKNTVEVLDSNPGLAIAFTNHYFLQNGQLIPRKRLVKPGVHEECISMVLGISPICLSAVLIRKTSFDEIGGFRPKILPADFDFCLRMARAGQKMYYIDKLLAVYRIHEEMESRNWPKIVEGMIAILSDINLPTPKDEKLRRRKLALFYRRLGMILFQAPSTAISLKEARFAFKQSLHIQPLSILAWSGLLLTYFTKRFHLMISWVRRVKSQH